MTEQRQCSQPAEIVEEIAEANILEKPKEGVHLEAHIDTETAVIIAEQIEETLKSNNVAQQLSSPPVIEEENPTNLEEQKLIIEEEILTQEKSGNVAAEATPNTKISESYEVHRSATRENVNIKDDGAREVIKDEIQASASQTKTSNSNESNEIIKSDDNEIQVKSFTKSEAIVSRLSEKKTTTTTTSSDAIDSKILKEILNFDKKSKDDQPDISENPVLVSELQMMPIETNGKDFIKNHCHTVINLISISVL